jgi:hypothetical protein
MLGVRRTSVTEVATKIQASGAISYSRGVIKIIDLEALKAMSCECYDTIRDEMRPSFGCMWNVAILRSSLPQLNIVTIDQLLGLILGFAVGRADQPDGPEKMAIKAYDVRAIIRHLNAPQQRRERRYSQSPAKAEGRDHTAWAIVANTNTSRCNAKF